MEGVLVFILIALGVCLFWVWHKVLNGMREAHKENLRLERTKEIQRFFDAENPVAVICRPEAKNKFLEECEGIMEVATDSKVSRNSCWLVPEDLVLSWRAFMGLGYSPLDALLKAKEHE